MKAFIKENKSSDYGSRFIFSLHKGKIKEDSFVWEEENEEFRYHQVLYDVVSIEKKNDRVEMVCLKDNEENNLEASLNEIHKQTKSSSTKSALHSFKFFSVFYFQKQHIDKIILLEIENKVYPISTSLYTAFFEIDAPPPRC